MQSILGSVEREPKPLIVKWLEQIVDRLELEGAHRVLLGRRDEHHRFRPRCSADCASMKQPSAVHAAMLTLHRGLGGEWTESTVHS